MAVPLTVFDPAAPPRRGRAPRRAGDGPDRVYAALRRDIIEQLLLPGTKLPEGDIARRFGVSRTVIRAALGRLAGEGLVVRASNQGARVARPSADEAVDILDLRRSIELIVVGRLAETGVAPATVADLRRHVAEEKRAMVVAGGEAAPAATSIRLSGEFHVRLAEAAGSPLLARYVSELVSRCSLLLSGQHLPHSGQCAVQEHQALIDCLARGDRAAAVMQMERHLAAVADRALAGRPGRRPLLCDPIPGAED